LQYGQDFAIAISANLAIAAILAIIAILAIADTLAIAATLAKKKSEHQCPTVHSQVFEEVILNYVLFKVTHNSNCFISAFRH
jgi:hypothetical protein